MVSWKATHVITAWGIREEWGRMGLEKQSESPFLEGPCTPFQDTQILPSRATEDLGVAWSDFI